MADRMREGRGHAPQPDSDPGPSGNPSVSTMPVPVVIPRDAATVVIAHEHNDRISEVLLLKRTSKASFLASAHVFPGGAVDVADADIALVGHNSETTESRYVVAAIRECFEESGILLASRRNSRQITDDDRARWRKQLDAGEFTFRELVEHEQLHLHHEQVHYLSRWVTPVGSPKRFDTRFFVAIAPQDQHATPDEREITESIWLEPSDALARADRNEMLLILPTRKTLEALVRAGSIHALTQNADRRV